MRMPVNTAFRNLADLGVTIDETQQQKSIYCPTEYKPETNDPAGTVGRPAADTSVPSYL
jgi:hypothetical protein